MKNYKPVLVKPGDPWIDGLEEVCRYGGWTDRAYQKEILDKSTASLEMFMENTDYPDGDGEWFKADCFRDGKLTGRDTYLFVIPEELFDKVFAPKFNEHGEIAP